MYLIGGFLLSVVDVIRQSEKRASEVGRPIRNRTIWSFGELSFEVNLLAESEVEEPLANFAWEGMECCRFGIGVGHGEVGVGFCGEVTGEVASSRFELTVRWLLCTK